MLTVAAAFGLINLVTFLSFRSDKLQAGRQDRRAPELRLLLLAAAGGILGAYAARKIYRHKTRKQPFTAQLHGIAGVQAAFLLAFLLYALG